MTSLQSRLDRVLERRTAHASPLEALLASIPKNDAELLRRCAIPHQFTAKTLLVLDPDLSNEEAAYARLQRLSLVIRTPEGSALHDDVRRQLFCDWLAPEHGETFALVSRRLYDALQTQMARAEGEAKDQLLRRSIFHQMAFEPDKAMDDFELLADRSRANLRFTATEALIRLIREYEPAFRPIDQLIVKYQEARLAADRGDTKQAIPLFRGISDSSDAPPLLRARSLYRLGRAYIEERDYARAGLALVGALAGVGEGLPERPAIIRWQGVIARETGNLDFAERLFRQSAELAESADDDYAIAAAYNALGSTFRESGELRRAIEMFEKAIRHLRDLPFDLARVYHNLGTTLMDLRQFSSAEEQFKKSLEIKRSGGDTIGEAYSWTNLAYLYHAQEQDDRAIEAAVHAIDLFEEGYDWYNAATVAMTLASFLAKTKPEDARKNGERAIVDYGREGDIGAQANARRDLDVMLDPRQQLSPWFWIILMVLSGISLIAGIVMWVTK